MALNLAIVGKAGESAGGSIGAGAATGATVGSVVPGVGTAVGAAVGSVVGAVRALFGTGDVSPFQDQMINNLADLAARGKVWAFQMLMGESGRWGLVQVDGGRTAHLAEFNANLPNVGGTASDSTTKWYLDGASNWGGNIAQYPDRDKFAGTTERFGSTDLAYQAAKIIADKYGFALPAPTVSPWQGGYKNNTNSAGYNVGPEPADEKAAMGGRAPFVFRPTFPAASGAPASVGLISAVASASPATIQRAGVGLIGAALLALLWIGTRHRKGR